MKHYMCVYVSDKGPAAQFFDKQIDAEVFRMNCVCGMGWACQVYEYDPVNQWYEFTYE